MKRAWLTVIGSALLLGVFGLTALLGSGVWERRSGRYRDCSFSSERSRFSRRVEIDPSPASLRFRSSASATWRSRGRSC